MITLSGFHCTSFFANILLPKKYKHELWLKALSYEKSARKLLVKENLFESFRWKKSNFAFNHNTKLTYTSIPEIMSFHALWHFQHLSLFLLIFILSFLLFFSLGIFVLSWQSINFLKSKIPQIFVVRSWCF